MEREESNLLLQPIDLTLTTLQNLMNQAFSMEKKAALSEVITNIEQLQTEIHQMEQQFPSPTSQKQKDQEMKKLLENKATLLKKIEKENELIKRLKKQKYDWSIARDQLDQQQIRDETKLSQRQQQLNKIDEVKRVRNQGKRLVGKGKSKEMISMKKASEDKMEWLKLSASNNLGELLLAQAEKKTLVFLSLRKPQNMEKLLRNEHIQAELSKLFDSQK